MPLYCICEHPTGPEILHILFVTINPWTISSSQATVCCMSQHEDLSSKPAEAGEVPFRHPLFLSLP